MLLLSILAMITTIPGQTIGISLFNDRLMASLSLTRNQLSMAYLIGTIISAMILTYGGKAYDRLGGRRLVVLVTGMLAVTLLLLSSADTIVNGLVQLGLPQTAASMIIITIGFFLLRFFAQGMLGLISKNLIMEWFVRRRGQVNAVHGVSMALAVAMAPRLIDPYIEQYSWNSAWRLMALLVFGFCIAAGIFYRNKPEDFGLKPDGNSRVAVKPPHADAMPGRSFTLFEARKTFAFWLFVGTVTMASLLGTSVTFHIISIFTEAGYPRSTAVGIFLPMSVVTITVQFIGSWASDHIPIKWLALTHNVGCIITSLGVIFLSPGTYPILLVLGMGILQGMMGITGNITWARYFGRMHLGSITGNAQSWFVAGSALGPYLFSFIFEQSGSYRAAAIIFGVLSLVLAGLSTVVKRPR